jgi:hypothetical protein
MRRLALLAVTLLAPVALACPVCGTAATEQGQEAYKFMSIIMSVLPLLAIGGVVAWVASRVRAAEKADADELARRVTHFGPSSPNGRDVA